MYHRTMSTFAANEPAGGAAFGQIVIATAGAMVITAVLLMLGYAHRTGRSTLLTRAGARATAVTGQPGWSAFPTLLAAVFLQVALLGMYWDISLHIDQGRDAGPLANPAHYLILLGLFGIFAAGFLAIVMPPEDDPDLPASSVRIVGGWRAPLGGILIAACGAFALIGFPLDDAWHRLFGQDVTLWGPTHLMLIGGAAMTLIGIAVLEVEGHRARTPEMKEAGRSRVGRIASRVRTASLCGGLLIGLSTFQGEFDFGVPQFRLLFHPVLIVLAASMALVVARMYGGRGTALGAVLFFLALRGLIALIVGPVFGETTPHLPLYLAEAGVVELLAFRRDPARPYAFGALAGLLIGTVGVAAEWAWSHLWMPLPWPSSLLPDVVVLAPIAGVAGGLLGAYAATALRGEAPAWRGSARIVVPLAGLALAAVLGFGLITEPLAGVTATIARQADGNATVRIDPPSAGADAEWLTVTAWQGGGLQVDRLRKTGPGAYATHDPVPATGEWKSMVRLQQGDAIMAAPFYLPEDRAIPVKGVPAPRTAVQRPFRADKQVLQREAKTGVPGSLTLVGYLVVLAIALSLIGLLGWGLARVSSRAGTVGATDRRPPAPAAPRARGLEANPA
jgi:hypothetical protein